MFKKLAIGVVGLIIVIIVISAVSGGGKPAQVTSSTGQPAASAAPKVGDTVTKGNWAYTVVKTEKPGKSIDTGNQFLKLDALGTWFAVYMSLKNVGNANFPINTTDFELQDAAGAKSNVTSKIVEMNAWQKVHQLQPLGQQIPPGVSFDAGLLFDVNPEAKGLKLNLKQANTLVDLE